MKNKIYDSLEEKLLAFVIRGNGDECWEIGLGKTKDGYVLMGIRAGRKYAHRVSYEYFVGEIPEGMVIDHLCNNRGCVNPKHLKPENRYRNMARAFTDNCMGRPLIFGGMCNKNRHKITDESDINRIGHWISCRKCRNESKRRSDAKRRANV